MLMTVRQWPLRAKILLASSVMVLALIGATLAYVGVQANAFATERMTEDLAASEQIVKSAEADRFRNLQLTAQVLASFPQLRALLETTDAATIRDFLRDFQTRTPGAGTLVVLTPNGETLARTDAVAALPVDEVRETWIGPLIAGHRPQRLLATTTTVSHAAAEIAEAGGNVFGFLIAGAPVDDAFAQQLRGATGEDVIVLGQDRVLGSTLAASDIPWRSASEWESLAGRRDSPLLVSVAGEEYAVRGTTAPSTLTYVMLHSRDRALAPYRRIQSGLLLLGMLAVGLGVVASALLARSITAPVARLVEATEQVAAGNFHHTVDVKSGDELGALARSFNAMTRGLRERADMQKFVSQSTMEMIQSPVRASAGERKHLTILFSDIRGFSRFAEERPPEDAVEWLNRCLGMQAELVRKHGGDVDKFVGDGLFALFAGNDMAFDAVRCAVEIHRGMDALIAPGGTVLDLGMGIVTGDVILGSIGGGNRLDFTAVGNQVNICSRLCAMAAPREILVAESTYLLVRDLVSAEPRSDVVIRGLAQPIDVYSLKVPRG
jgi:class 3 adenylate cyclase